MAAQDEVSTANDAVNDSSEVTHVCQVTNVSPGATVEQLNTLFGFLGEIEELKLFPSETQAAAVTSKVCFVKYKDCHSVQVARHLSNSVFIDRALIVIPASDGCIPDDQTAMTIAAAVNLNPASSNTGIPADVMASALGIPAPPPLPGNQDPAKIDEIRRTIYVGNLNSKVTADQLLTFFSTCGEIRYVRMGGDASQPTRFAFIEYSEKVSVYRSIALSGITFADKPLKINYSKNAIVKPQVRNPEIIQREVENAMKQVRESTGHSAEPGGTDLSTKRRHSRSHSKSRERRRRTKSRSRSIDRPYSRKSRSISPRSRRYRDRSRERKRRSRSRDRRRSSSRSRDKRRRSRSRRRSTSRSRGRRRRSPSDHRRSRSGSKSRDKNRRQRKSSTDQSSRSRSRSKSKDRERRRHRHSRSRSKSKDRKRRRSSSRHRSSRRSRSDSRDRHRRTSRDRRHRSRSRSSSPKHRHHKSKKDKRDRDDDNKSSSRDKKGKETKEEKDSTNYKEVEKNANEVDSVKDTVATDNNNSKVKEASEPETPKREKKKKKKKKKSKRESSSSDEGSN